MPTSTPAQITAAATAIKKRFDVYRAFGWSQTQLEDIARAALIAAAQAGEPTDVMGAWDERYSGSAKEIEAHTIERCAAAILKLKDAA
jgi:hypothetical protein